MSKIIRIGNGQGFWGDSIDAPINLVNEGPLDYLTLDYLAEVTLSIMQRQKLKNSNLGYASDFLNLTNKILPNIKENNLKVITNAGGVNPQSCRAKLLEIANNNIKIGVIEGDDIYSRLKKLRDSGVAFDNMETGESFSQIENRIYSANVYIDSFAICEALDKGAQIVLAGRVSDPGLVLGPCLHEFSWKANEYDKIASGTLAGHIIECGAQCTGGNFTDWELIPDLYKIGYPIVEMEDTGQFIICKHENTGGLINRETITEQILYEMGDPKKYISPDVCVDFTSFKLKDLKNNRVKINKVKGFKSTDTYKVSISYFAGYKASGQLTISGPKAYEKAKLTSEIIWKRLERAGYKFNNTSTEYLGYSSCHGEIGKMSNELNEVILRLGVKDDNKDKVNRFGMELAPVITSGPPGITGFSGGRPKAQEVIAYWPSLISKEFIETKISVL